LKKIAVLGASGSIGTSAIDVIRRCRDVFEPVLFSVNKNTAALQTLAGEFPGAAFAVESAPPSAAKPGFFTGDGAVLRALEAVKPDIAVNGIGGSAGLLPSLKAVELGISLALANKESVVMAWELLTERAEKTGAALVPVDSECSAIFNLIARWGRENIDRIILTASGGPFRTTEAEKLAAVTAEDALQHPTWKMGAKITLDSATLANKGLELIQISKITGVDVSRIDVSVHPQSVVHSMISTIDGAVYAALSLPDMRLPIHQALHYPSLAPSPWGRMNFDARTAPPLALEFETPDTRKFPMLDLAYHAARQGGFYPVCYNAANEAAGERFFAGDIAFVDIPKIAARVLERDWSAGETETRTIEAVLDADTRARAAANEVVF
jgi:1-deoxy-D-xylulose-5-phosphate reductoisomerase